MTRSPGVPGPAAAPDAALVGAPQARRLVREAMANPGRIRRVVVGPGGYGKSVLLDAVAGVYRDAGFSVLRGVATDGEPLGALARAPDVALIVDDAHLLGAAELDRLAQLGADDSAVPLVVAHRPWPRSPALAALGALLAAGCAPVVLEALDRPGVAARAARLLGERPRPDLVDHVLELTAGMPGLVDRLLAALVALAPASDPTAVPLTDHPPAGLLAQLGYTLESLGGDILEMLLARAVGAPPDPDVLGALLGFTGGILDELTDAAHATGLIAADGRPIPLVSAAVLAGTSAARSLALRRKLAEIELRRGGNVLVAARGLLGTGATGTELVAVFTAAAEDAVRAGTVGAAELYDAAVTAGASALELAARRAEAAMQAGDLDVALNQADQVLSAADRLPTDDVVLAGMVAAAVLARRGLLARSAELYRWLGTVTGAVAGSEALLAVPVLIGTGALGPAREVLHRTSTSPASEMPPTLRSGAEELMAQGILDSVVGSPTAALSKLARAAALLASSTRTALLPDTPAALAALVAVQCGELDVARSLLEEAIDADPGGRTAATRHRLLLAWIAMSRGATAQTQDLLVGVPGEGDLEPRDELLAAALDVALARRTSDLGALMSAWGRAREAVVRHPVDLYSLQPLGELLVGAARLREQRWVAPHLDEAWVILDRLGGPALWSVPLHWSCLQAGIAAGLGDVAGRHAAALLEVAESSRYATAMATAGGVWLRVLGGEVDAVAVDSAARGLHAVGLTWEGGRLAGQAAIRTHDRKDMSALLSCARALQVGTGPVAAPSAPSDGSVRVTDQGRRRQGAEPIDGGPGALSDREREVAELVLTGMTYKQIGEQLFISAKTVEHHVSRMRQRLGSGSRGELFAQLRMVVGKSAGRAG
ncbi:MAG: LuxR C-terminal-related transcriptional regulator [Pseudonocardia sp.]